MIIPAYYLVEKKNILITGEYDQNGKLCTRVMAGDAAFLVDRSPLQLLDDTLQYIGFDLRGAMNGAKSVINRPYKCPIIVNPYQGICYFPSKSPYKPDCIWFNPEHIVKTKAYGRRMTEVVLSNGHSMIVDSKLAVFNDKLQAAEQLWKRSMDRGLHQGSIQFYLEPKEGHQLFKEKTGKYNFEILEIKRETTSSDQEETH